MMPILSQLFPNPNIQSQNETKVKSTTLRLNRVDVQDKAQFVYDLLVCQLEQQLKNNAKVNSKFKFNSTKISSVRFLHSVIENLTIRLNYADICQYTEWIKPTITAYRANQQNYRARLVELFSSYLHLRLDPENVVKCHNVCVLIIMLQKLPDFMTQLSSKLVFTFLMRNLFNVKTFFNDPQRMINLFVVIDRMKLSEQHKVELLYWEQSVLSTLWWCADLYGRSDCVTRLVAQSNNNQQINYMHLQVGFCARWFLERILLGQSTLSNHFICRQRRATLNRKDKSKHLKLSPDCYSARSDWNCNEFKWQYVRSTCAVNSGVHYFEVVLITGGPMLIGWTNAASRGTNEEIFTIALNGHDKCLYRKKRERFEKNAQIQNINLKLKCQWSPGDVVGCLINFNKFKFEFYLNGQLVQLQDAYKCIPEGQQAYHASISLSEHQQCYCNFGQIKFRYAPKNIKYPYFYNHDDDDDDDDDDHVINVHIESKSEPKWYEFKQDILRYDRVERMFANDDKQTQMNELVKQIERNIHSKQPLEIDLSRENECLRMIQSIVEQIGTLLDSKLDILINLIDQHLIRHLTANVNPHFPDLVCQVLYPYFQLHFAPDTIITHRNVCAMLCLLSSVITDLNIRINLYKQMITYLYNLVIKYCDYITLVDHKMSDEWILMLAIVALENLDLDDVTKQMIRDSRKLCKILEAQSYSTFVKNVANYEPRKSKYLLLQSQFCTQRFLRKVLKKDATSTTVDVVSIEKPTKLSSTNCSAKLKLSQDRLVARSDSNWQSVRSNCCTKQPIYYEVTLHTNGPMRIGWATGQTNLAQRPIRNDRHSIGYDGYNRLVWHNNVSYPVNAAQWKAGDIVGCLISPEKFAFNLNECAIECPKLIHHSVRAYFAAASLSSQQQCGFNFSKPKYHWRQPSSRNFDSIGRIKIGRSFHRRVKKRPTNANNNSIVAHQSSQLQVHGNIQMTYNVYSAKSSAKQASCSTESTVSTRKKYKTQEFSYLENEQLLNEIMEEENEEEYEEGDDGEFEDDFDEMNCDESEA